MYNNVMRKKAQIWISVVIYVLVVTAIIAIILQAGIPLLNDVRDNNKYSKAKNTFASLDSYIREVASEGAGSQRVVTLEIHEGELILDNDAVALELETQSELLEPRSSVKLGNLVIISGSNVKATEYNDSYVLENNRILVNITKFGNSTSYVDINTTNLIKYIKLKENSVKSTGSFSFFVDGSKETAKGTGYTSILNTGDNLGFATVVAYMNTSTKRYELHLTLESDADFLIADVKNLVYK